MPLASAMGRNGHPRLLHMCQLSGILDAVGTVLGRTPGWQGKALLEKHRRIHGTVAQRHSSRANSSGATETPPGRKAGLGPKQGGALVSDHVSVATET